MAPQDIPTVNCVLEMLMVTGTAPHRAAWSQDTEAEGAGVGGTFSRACLLRVHSGMARVREKVKHKQTSFLTQGKENPERTA